MSMGYSAAFAIVIEQEAIEKMKLKSFEKFLEGLKEHNIPLSNFADGYSYGDVIYDENGNKLSEDLNNKLYDLFEKFEQEFKAHTGIGINIGYHDSESRGSRYDEVDDVFFCLEFSDVYEMTEEAKVLQKMTNFDWKYFVSYG